LPQGVKQKLLIALPNSPFIQQAESFYYQTPSGFQIQIDITPEWQVSTPHLDTPGFGRGVEGKAPAC